MQQQQQTLKLGKTREARALKGGVTRPGKLESEAVREHATARRKWVPVVIKGIDLVGHRTFGPADYKNLDVDPEYQRGETKMVGEIIAALQAGGTVPDPPSLAIRKSWQPGPKLWVMDGQQRICAFQYLNLDFTATVYTSASLESERAYFMAMNARLALNSNTKVKAYNGPVADLLKLLNSREGSEVSGRVTFGTNSGNELSASVMVTGIERLLSGRRGTTRIDKVLSRTDALLKTNEEKLTATTFCRLVALVFPKYALKLPVLALAEVARDRWSNGAGRPMPSPGSLKRLRAINWRDALPGGGGCYQELANAVVGKAWRK